MGEYTVVPLEEQYVDRVAVLVKDAWIEHASTQRDYLNLELFQSFDYKRFLTNQTLDNPFARAWVGLLETTAVVGFARIEHQNADRYRAFKEFILIDDIIVTPPHADGGLRDQFLGVIEEYSKKHSIENLFTRVYSVRPKDAAWFSKRGFEAVHTEYLKRTQHTG